MSPAYQIVRFLAEGVLDKKGPMPEDGSGRWSKQVVGVRGLAATEDAARDAYIREMQGMDEERKQAAEKFRPISGKWKRPFEESIATTSGVGHTLIDLQKVNEPSSRLWNYEAGKNPRSGNMLITIEAVIFDFDGVIPETEIPDYEA
jgi:hypothetical protein